MKTPCCCFIGHRKIEDTPELRDRLQSVLSELIEAGTISFIFGDHSAFNDLCYETITKLKEKYPEIMRIAFRTNYEEADDYTMKYLLEGYEDSICPKGISKAGRAKYIERNQAMIRGSDICIFYFNENYTPTLKKNSGNAQPQSGTALAYAYAEQKKKQIYNLYRE